MSGNALQTVGIPRDTPQRVLVLGCTGMLGRSWVRLLEESGIKHAALSRPAFDLSKPDTIDAAFDQEYDLVVNAAAWTDVDGAEADEPGAMQANAHAVEQIAQRCRDMKALLINYSTDYVFSGSADHPYPVGAQIEPINAYGRSKALGELLLRERTANHLLIRTSWVYAPWGNNFVRTMMRLISEKDQLRVVDDQRGRPTSAMHLASSSFDLYKSGAAGTWHLTDSGECSWFEFAKEIRTNLSSECSIEPCSSDEYPRPAKRPTYSTLDIEPTNRLLGGIESWQVRLREAMREAANERA